MTKTTYTLNSHALTDSVLYWVAYLTGVETKSVLLMPEVMKIVLEVVADENAHIDLAQTMGEYVVRSYRAKVKAEEEAKQAKLLEMRKYWETKA